MCLIVVKRLIVSRFINSMCVWCTRRGAVSQPKHLYVYWFQCSFVSHSMTPEQRQIITLSISVKMHDDLTLLHQGLPANYLCARMCVFNAGVESWKSDGSLWASVWQREASNQRTSAHSTSGYWSRFNRPPKRPLIGASSRLIGHHSKRQGHTEKRCVLIFLSYSTWEIWNFGKFEVSCATAEMLTQISLSSLQKCMQVRFTYFRIFLRWKSVQVSILHFSSLPQVSLSACPWPTWRVGFELETTSDD